MSFPRITRSCILPAAALVLFGWPMWLRLTQGAAAAPPQASGAWRLSLASLLASTPHDHREVHVTLADIDGNGRKELIAASDSGRVQVWKWYGRSFASIYGPKRLVGWPEASAHYITAGAMGGSRNEELLAVSDNGIGEAALGTYRWTKGSWRLTHQYQTFTAYGLVPRYGLVALLRAPMPSRRTLVLLSSNAEDLETSLSFCPLRAGRLEAGEGIYLGSYAVEHFGSAVVDLPHRGVEDLVVVLVGEIFQGGDRTPFAPKLQRYSWSPTAREFQLVQEMEKFPPGLRLLFGAARRGAQTFLLGIDGKEVVMCQWDGKDFRPRPTGVFPTGDPVTCGDLLGDGSCEVVSLEGDKAIWVSRLPARLPATRQ